MPLKNLFQNIPDTLPNELFETLVSADGLRIERILSDGQMTPEGEWYDQKQNEWILVLQGSGTLLFEDDSTLTLEKGDFTLIPKRKKHRVAHTAARTLWLAVHFD